MFTVAGKDYRTDEYILRAACDICGKDKELRVPTQALFWWHQGQHIQDCFHMLGAADRELLKTNICGECWERMFKPRRDEEEEEDE